VSVGPRIQLFSIEIRWTSPTRDPRRLIPAERFGGIVDRRQAAAEDGGILDGHGAACSHVGTHRVAGVSQEDDPTVAPAIAPCAIADRRDRHVHHRLDEATEIGVEVREGFDEPLACARQRGLLALPGRGWHAAHQVDLVACAGHEVGENVPIVTPPLGAVPNGFPP
jgi:hypothetical protein